MTSSSRQPGGTESRATTRRAKARRRIRTGAKLLTTNYSNYHELVLNDQRGDGDVISPVFCQEPHACVAVVYANFNRILARGCFGRDLEPVNLDNDIALLPVPRRGVEAVLL